MTRKAWWIAFVLSVVSLGGESEARRSDLAEKSYFQARSLLRKKQYVKADALFEKTLVLLSKKKPKTEKSRHLVSLGRCDIFYHLALSAKEQKNERKACRALERLSRLYKTVPAGWTEWEVNRLLIGRMEKAQELAKSCQDLPSLLELKELPPNTTILMQVSAADGKTTWVKVKNPLETKLTTFKLRFQAPEYKTYEREFKVERWSEPKETIKLEKKPKPKPRPRVRKKVRRPPPPPPRKLPPKADNRWIIWTAVGVGAAAVIVGGVAIWWNAQERDVVPVWSTVSAGLQGEPR